MLRFRPYHVYKRTPLELDFKFLTQAEELSMFGISTLI